MPLSLVEEGMEKRSAPILQQALFHSLPHETTENQSGQPAFDEERQIRNLSANHLATTFCLSVKNGIHRIKYRSL
jgi:hypothetical protein